MKTATVKSQSLFPRPCRTMQPPLGLCELLLCLCELGRCVWRVWLPQSHCGQRLSHKHAHHTQGGAGRRGYRAGRWLQLHCERRESERSDSGERCLPDCNHRYTLLSPGLISLFVKLQTFSTSLTLFLPFLSLMSAIPCARSACRECVRTCVLTSLGAGSGVCGSLPSEPAT